MLHLIVFHIPYELLPNCTELPTSGHHVGPGNCSLYCQTVYHLCTKYTNAAVATNNKDNIIELICERSESENTTG